MSDQQVSKIDPAKKEWLDTNALIKKSKTQLLTVDELDAVTKVTTSNVIKSSSMFRYGVAIGAIIGVILR